MSSLYEQIGGQPAVKAAVDLFYRKVLTDDRISEFFDGVDMDRQIAKQKGFLTMAAPITIRAPICEAAMRTSLRAG